MTLAEFKAWFEGFTESMDAPPTAKQWKRIKERVAAIDGVAVTREVIYRDRYWPTLINNPIYSYPTWATSGGISSNTAISGTAGNLIDLGRAEYNSVLAA